jgi:hypothetical protein
MIWCRNDASMNLLGLELCPWQTIMLLTGTIVFTIVT